MSTPDPSPDMPRDIDHQLMAGGRRITFMAGGGPDVLCLNIRDPGAKLEDSREHIVVRKEQARELFNWLGVWLHTQ